MKIRFPQVFFCAIPAKTLKLLIITNFLKKLLHFFRLFLFFVKITYLPNLRMDISCPALKLIKSFPNNRFQHIMLYGQSSNWLPVKAGIP